MAAVLTNDPKHSLKLPPKLYNGGIKDWINGDRISVKSCLHSYNLLNVVLHGVATKASRTVAEPGPFSSPSFVGTGTEPPQFITPKASSGVPGGPGHSTSTTASSGVPGGPGHPTFKVLLQNKNIMMSGGRDGTKILGPLDAATVIDMIERGDIDKDSSLIANYPDGFWEEFSLEKELELHKIIRSQARVAPLTLPAPEPQEGRTEADDRNAYHLLMQLINNKCDTGRALLQQADNIFGNIQSGYELFKWLDERAKASVNDDGLINAEDALQDVLEFQLPEGELTKEIIIVQGDAFKTLWFKQPQERWGINSDVFKAWTEKFPPEPFKGLLDQIYSLDLLTPGSGVVDNFEKANRICSALSTRVGATTIRR